MAQQIQPEQLLAEPKPVENWAWLACEEFLATRASLSEAVPNPTPRTRNYWDEC